MTAAATRTLLFRPLPEMMILVHGAEAPSDEDWSRYVDALEAYGRGTASTRLLVVTDDVGPSSAQRAELARRSPKGAKIAVVTGSAIARGIVTLIGWVEPGIRAFPPAGIRAGLDYLGVAVADQPRILEHVAVLKMMLSTDDTRESRRVAELSALVEAFELRDKEFQRELYDARDFQKRLVDLPRITNPNAKVQSFYEPMSLIGGDLYALTQHGSRLRLFIADATGHGIRAAMTTMFIKNGYQSFAHLDDPSSLLEALNDSIASTYSSAEMMFTAACADIDLDSGKATFACAGHAPACAVKSGETIVLEPEGAPMGVRAGMKYEAAAIHLDRGDGIYLYTDGISEALHGRLRFGEARLHETIRRAHIDREDVAARVRRDLLAYVGSYLLTDDASLIGLRLEH